MLKGKAKEDFEKWFCQQKDLRHGIDFLEDIPFSMQYGVYVDWFDSVGINIDVKTGGKGWYYSIFVKNYESSDNYYCRNEARTKAIEKACEIYNSNYEKVKPKYKL
jgi:hypothetical protein